ncbi:hypothetical protein QTH87_17170 [Variovorax sp. J22P168]|uniref:hypothetical protein n=1 Tax=Variovorax jilinensis TaxID=3053513 RepID=UPI0025787A39|nr:hypothetical protein [Variovorax sp. J22P168]MDM0014172.1 hypothetical protein [Variovorax sp. J22P168]
MASHFGLPRQRFHEEIEMERNARRIHPLLARLAGCALIAVLSVAAVGEAEASRGTLRFKGSIVASPHGVALAASTLPVRHEDSARGVEVMFSDPHGQSPSAQVHAEGPGGFPVDLRCIDVERAPAGGCLLGSTGGRLAVAAPTVRPDGASIMTVSYD